MGGFEDKSVLKAKYRNRTEIIASASVLEAAKDYGTRKTRIMFTAYLSYKQLTFPSSVYLLPL
ncbi:MAG: winged helix-turn-helix domain-containing protein [Nitrososphaeraceae archaeon]